MLAYMITRRRSALPGTPVHAAASARRPAGQDKKAGRCIGYSRLCAGSRPGSGGMRTIRRDPRQAPNKIAADGIVNQDQDVAPASAGRAARS